MNATHAQIISDALASLAKNYSHTATQTVLGGDGMVGLALALLCFALALLITWGILRSYVVALGAPAAPPPGPNPDKAAPAKYTSVVGPLKPLLGEGLMALTFGGVLTAIWDTLIVYLRGLASAAGEVIPTLLTDWPLLVGLVFAIAGAIVWLEFHDIILDVSFESVQCYVRPIVDGFIFPIFNALRVVLSGAWPFFNGSADIIGGVTYGNGLVFLTCVDASVLENVVSHLALALKDLMTGLANMVANFLNNGRWDMVTGLEEIGQAINSTRAVWDCYCPDASPILDAVYGVFLAPSLYVAIDCGVNVPVRTWEILFNLIFNGQSPNTTLWAEEFVCADFAIGSYAEDLFSLAIEFLIGIGAILEEIIEDAHVDSAAVSGASYEYVRMAAAYTRATQVMNVPDSVKTMLATPGAVPMRAYTMSAMSAIDQSIIAAYGTKASLFREVDPVIAAEMSAAQLPLPNISYIIDIGVAALQRLAASPWSDIVTATPALTIGVFNLTVNAICHPFQAFGHQQGLAFFQIGYLGDYTRLQVAAIADLLVLFSEALPCTFSKPLQAVASTLEGFFEFVIGSAFAARFPPWQMGIPPPVNCSITNCTQGVANFSLAASMTAYYNWSTSRLRRNLVLLEEGGECTAFLLGCNTTADNNNSTNTTSNCTDAPLACTARSLNRIVVSTVNLTLALVMNLPTYLHFNGSEPTFSDLPTQAVELSLEDFLLCFGLLLDEFDFTGNHCLTERPPGPQPNGSLNLPPDDPIGVFGVPPRTEWECRLDGGAYYWDGRQVVVLNTSDIYDLNSTQYRCLINESRECVIAQADSVEVLGSAPENNVTLIIQPDWVDTANGSALILVYNATTGTLVSTLPNASTLADVYNVSNVTQEDCTHSLPLPAMLGPQYACSIADNATGAAVFISPFARDANYSIASFVYNELDPYPSGNPVECQADLPLSYTCGPDGIFRNGTHVVYYQNLALLPLTDRPVECHNNSYPPVFRNRILCQYNTLAFLAESPSPPLVWNVSTPVYWPMYTYPFGDATRVPLACNNIPPDGYVCGDVMAVSPPFAYLITEFIPGLGIAGLDCQNNTLTVAPTCTRITVSYTVGPDVIVELEGGEVRVYANDTKEAVPCVYQGITNSSAASFSASAHVSAAEEGVNLRTLVRRAQALNAARFATRGKHESRVRSELLRDPLGRGSLTLDRILARSWVAQQATRVFGADVPVHRIKSLVCCFSEFVTTFGDFVVQTVFAVVYLLQGILTLPANPSYEVLLPTFAASRDALRDAACALGCEIMSFIPFTLSCPNSAGGTCNDLTICGTNFLCDVADVLIVVVDFVVNLLTMIRALLLGQQPPPGSNILGSTCTPGNPSQCLTSFLIIVITAPIQATMQAARTLSGVGDCLLCALARVITPDAHCVGIFFAIVNTLATVIDQVATVLVSAFVNLGIGFLQFFIYFFAGQFGQAWNAFSTYVLGFLFTLFRNFALLILESAKKLPIIGPIISNILSFFSTACTTASHILTFFGARPLDCTSVSQAKKRGLQQAETHWLGTLHANVTLVWPTVGGCAVSMAALNATNLYDSVEDALAVRELSYCAAAHLWVGPSATPEADPKARPFPQPCDSFMPPVYARNQALHTLEAETQARVIECVDARLRAEYVRADQGYAGTWVPHDLYYPTSSSSSALQLLSDMLVAHQVWYSPPPPSFSKPEKKGVFWG
jgi:hypothetical protein